MFQISSFFEMSTSLSRNRETTTSTRMRVVSGGVQLVERINVELNYVDVVAEVD
jgi:hypothetical protein